MFALILLAIKVMSFKGSFHGLLKYLQPKFSKLMTVEMWCDAYVQMYSSLGFGKNVLVYYARRNKYGLIFLLVSYNFLAIICRYHHDFVRSAVLVAFMNVLISIFGGIVILSLVGSFSSKIGVNTDDIINRGRLIALIFE